MNTAFDDTSESSVGMSPGMGVFLTFMAIIIGASVLFFAFSDNTGLVDEENGSDADLSAEDSNTTETGEPDDDTSADSTPTDEINGSDDNETTDTTLDPSIETPPTVPPLITRPPETVKVVTVNGTNISGLAGASATFLASKGYVTSPKNAARPPTEPSTIFYKEDYHDDAKAVASLLSAPGDILTKAPSFVLTLIANPEGVTDYHIFVMIGTDGRIPQQQNN